MNYSRIIGTGGYLPEKVLTNLDLEKLVDTSDEWIFTRTGIRKRHIAAQDETAASMAEIVARQAMETAQVEANELDLIVLATSSPDRIFPSAASLVQGRLGAENCAAMDVQAACAGFIHALSVADQYIRAGTANKVLVIGSEVNSRILDWNDRSTCVIFGDGAGAVLLEAGAEPGIMSTHLQSDGSYRDLLFVPNPIGGQGEPNDQATMKMRGNEVFRVATQKLSEIAQTALTANNLHKEDIDWFVPHQANIRIISAMAKKLDLSMDRVVLTIENQGNTSGASVPLALDTAVRDGRIKPGDLVLMEAFGGGFVWGSALVRM
jgi:3-oxoacyl-[acyl-carrier-protein] synthase-3